VTKGRDDEALMILRRLHHDANDPEDSFAHQELSSIREQTIRDNGAQQDHGQWQIFRLKTYRRRLILACMLVVGPQNTGVLVINNYNALLYQSLGLSNTEALIVSAAYNTWGMIANFIGATMSDRFGRRKLLRKFAIPAIP
jgi:cyanate permease